MRCEKVLARGHTVCFFALALTHAARSERRFFFTQVFGDDVMYNFSINVQLLAGELSTDDRADDRAAAQCAQLHFCRLPSWCGDASPVHLLYVFTTVSKLAEP